MLIQLCFLFLYQFQLALESAGFLFEGIDDYVLLVDELFLLLDCSTAFILNNLDWHSDLEWYKIKYLVQLLIWLLSNHKTVD